MNPAFMMKMMQDMMPMFIANNPKVLQISQLNKHLEGQVQLLQVHLNEANNKM